MPDGGVLGLIAGAGGLPREIARCARRAGRRVKCVALVDVTDPEIDEDADVSWVRPGEVADGLGALVAAGVRQAVMAGKVPKLLLFGDPEKLQLDAQARRLLEQLEDRRDDSILETVAGALEQAGIELLPQCALAPELLAGEGVLGKVAPSRSEEGDIAFGLPIARHMGRLDIGQTVVVKDRAVMAVEAIEGTDEALRRGGALAGGGGGVAIKVAKPGQDPRFDVPTIGLATVRAVAEAGLRVLAFEAHATIVLDREALVAEADAGGIAVVGVEPAVGGVE
jgi:DUF1009 family protein